MKEFDPKELKQDAPAEFTVEAQNISDEELDGVAGGAQPEAGINNILTGPDSIRGYF